MSIFNPMVEQLCASNIFALTQQRLIATLAKGTLQGSDSAPDLLLEGASQALTAIEEMEKRLVSLQVRAWESNSVSIAPTSPANAHELPPWVEGLRGFLC